MFLARAPREGLIFFLMRGAWIATLPRLNCRGNFVEAYSWGRVSMFNAAMPRLNCRGNFVEAAPRAPSDQYGFPGLGLTAEATSLRPGSTDRWRARPQGLGLTAEATSLRLDDAIHFRLEGVGPRLNCRGNFVEADQLEGGIELGGPPRLNCRGNFVEASIRRCYKIYQGLGLGLTTEATSLRPERSGAPRTHCGLPRLNCRGNFVEAQRHAHPDVQERHGLGLTAEATSLRLFVGGLLGDALDSRLGLTAEATSLRPDT